DGFRRAGSSFGKAGVDLKSLLDRAAAIVADPKSPDNLRLEAIAFLALGPKVEGEKTLLPLLDLQQPQSFQLAALSSLDRLSPDAFASSLLDRLTSFTPAIR